MKLIEQAIGNDRLYELLIEEENKFISQYGIVPTDSKYVFNAWIKFVESSPISADELWKKFIDTILRISKHPELSWFSMQYLFSFLDYNRRKNEYPPGTQELIDQIVLNITVFEDKLKNDFRWVGDKKYNYSLWDDFVRMAKILAQDYPFTFMIQKQKE